MGFMDTKLLKAIVAIVFCIMAGQSLAAVSGDIILDAGGTQFSANASDVIEDT